MLITPLAVVLVASLAALRHAFKHAVDGYENESGFYEGAEPPPTQSFVKDAQVKQGQSSSEYKAPKGLQSRRPASVVKPPLNRVTKTHS
jgi:hypothetical protein